MKSLCWIAAALACGIAAGRARADLSVQRRKSERRDDRAAGSPIRGGSRSCPTAGCSSPSGRAACASSRATASSRRRSRACRRCARRARADCTTSCSTATSAPTARSISASPSPRPAAAAPRWRAPSSTDGEAPKLDDVKVIFRQEGPLSSGNHYGCRIVQGRDGNLWLTMGDHFSLSRRGAEPRQPHRQDRARDARRRRAAGQSVRRPQRREAGDLELRPPQQPGRGAASADRQAVGARARPARRRRDQHSARRQELRLAGDRLRHRLFGRARSTRRPRKPAWSSRSNTGCRRSRPPAWRSTPATCSRHGRATCSSARSPGRLLVRLELDGEKVGKEERLLTNLRERIRDVRQGPDGAIWLLTDSGNGKLLRVTPAK